MMKSLARMILAASLLSTASMAGAGEAEFLQSMEGEWSGKGTVRVRTNSSPIKVSCNIASDASGSSLALDGSCRGMVIVSRAIKATLKAKGGNYSGSYTGAGSGKAGLNGSRNGDAIDLGIRWAKEVNGDRTARLTVQKVGENGMRLTTVDNDPTTGKSVVTSEINLRRT